MFSVSEAKNMINELFEEEALVIGGLVAVHGVEDDLVWRLIRNLDVIRARTLRKLSDNGGDDHGTGEVKRVNLNPHPAIHDFLLKIKRENEWQKSASG